LLVTFVGTRYLNSPTDMCKFKSSQKDKTRPVGRFLESFAVNREVSIVHVRRFIFLELMLAALMRIAHLWN